jgi:hypothetical protein
MNLPLDNKSRTSGGIAPMTKQSDTKGRLELLLICFCGLLAADHTSAQTWTKTTATNKNWTCVTSSADGSKLAAAVNGGGIYVSADSGVTWALATNAPHSISVDWVSIASSADGTKLVATAPNIIYTTLNSGVTWVSNSVPALSWTSVASSGDGRALAAGAPFAQPVYLSTNSGTNWATTSPPSNDKSYAALSANGKQLAVALNVGAIYISTNWGTTWRTSSAPRLGWSAIASSADGAGLVAGTSGFGGPSPSGAIYSSTDAGANWRSNNVPNLGWASVASSADGVTLAAVAFSGTAVFISTNSGVTWTSNSVPGATSIFSSVAASADGSKLVVAGANNSGIWTYQSTPTPKISLKASSNGLAFSWIVPSSPFVLQQSSNLTATNWLTLTNTPTLNLTNMQNEVVLPPSGATSFYRLAAP